MTDHLATEPASASNGHPPTYLLTQQYKSGDRIVVQQPTEPGYGRLHEWVIGLHGIVLPVKLGAYPIRYDVHLDNGRPVQLTDKHMRLELQASSAVAPRKDFQGVENV
jgi:hypothetical protein